ncbi:MAG: hypothetical protein ACTHJS_14615, partial [Xanthobacteraceae bacterium]
MKIESRRAEASVDFRNAVLKQAKPQALFRRLPSVLEQRQHTRPLAGFGYNNMTFRHRRPIFIMVKRFGHNNDATIRFPEVQCISVIVDRIAKGIKI